MVPSRADPPEEPLSSIPPPSPPLSTAVLIVAVLLAAQVGLCAADSDLGTVTWIFPKGGEVFHRLDTVNVTYQSSYAEPWLYIWCYEDEAANKVRFIRKKEGEPHNASVLVDMDFSTTTPCWFNLRDNAKSDIGRNTKKWSLSQAERKSGPVTTGAAMPSATATSSTAAPTSAGLGPTAAAAQASGGGDISSAAKAGLGIGVGIATSLLCAGAFWLYYRHVKRKEHHQEVYRRIVGSGQGGGSGGPGHDAFSTGQNNNNHNHNYYYGEHLEPWRYGGTPQPAPSAWSGVSDPSSSNSSAAAAAADWYAGQQYQYHHHHQYHQATAANAPYQYYDPVGGSSHQLGAMAAGAAQHHPHHSSQPSVTTTASMTAEPTAPARGPVISNNNNQPAPAPAPDAAAAIRDVRDLSSSLYPSEYNNNNNSERPVSPESVDDRTPAPPARVASVNYGPNGPRDASTGADFTLLPGYTGGRGYDDDEAADDDLYGPATPPPPPPHSAHARQGQGHNAAAAVELPTVQTHRGGYGPRAELPAAAAQLPLRGGGPEQKVLLRDVAALRRGAGGEGG